MRGARHVRVSPSGRWPLRDRLHAAVQAAPLAVAAAIALEVALLVMDLIWSNPPGDAAIVAFGTASAITFIVGLAMSNERAFLASVLTLATASAFADLPVSRGGATVFAAAAGAIVLAFAEAGGAALEPSGTGKQLGRPTGARVTWAAATAIGGAVAGWLLVSVRAGVAGLGPIALGIGVAAAVGLIVLAGMLTRSAVAADRSAVTEPQPIGGRDPLADGDRSDGDRLAGVTQLALRAPSRRARRRARGTRLARRARPPRSAPSSG